MGNNKISASFPFMFSEQPGSLVDFLKTEIDSSLKYYKIIEIGGGYGRDAFRIADFADVLIVDKNPLSYEHFLKYKSQYFNNSNKKVDFINVDFLNENTLKKKCLTVSVVIMFCTYLVK